MKKSDEFHGNTACRVHRASDSDYGYTLTATVLVLMLHYVSKILPFISHLCTWTASCVYISFTAGVLPRSVGVAPEKALKMVAWSISLGLIDNHYSQCPQTLRWLIGGTVAGAATTIFGKLVWCACTPCLA